MESKKALETKVSAILLMGGLGTRFGSDLPKQFHKIGGKPVYLYTLEAFLKSALFSEVILVYPEGWEEKLEKDLSSYRNKIKIALVLGGETRQESSYRGLRACTSDTEYVVIHDAVRPFVSQAILLQNVLEVQQHGAVDTCIPSSDTLVYSSQGQFIDKIPVRKEYRRGQTPQSFSYPLILQAHHCAQKSHIENSTDDCALVLQMGHPVRIVEGEDRNMKITTELDLFLAEQMLHFPQNPSPGFQPEQNDLQGKVFAITGGTGGIGSALCTELERAGAKVILLSPSSASHPVDLRRYDQTQTTFQKIYEEYGPLDGLINSVGTFSTQAFYALTPVEIEQIISSNLNSVIYSCQCAHMKKGAHIVNISSSSYTRGRKDYLIYSASKAAVVNFTQGLAEALPDLHVNVIVPQRTDTQMRRTHFPNEPKETLLRPEQIAEKIIHLLKRTTVTGSIIEVRKAH